MIRTISIKLNTTPEQSAALLQLQILFNKVCNKIALIALENKCFNRVKLHHLAYFPIRNDQENGLSKLGATMVCSAIGNVCGTCKALKNKNKTITFKQKSAIHYHKKNYSLKEETLSLYTLSGRYFFKMNLGDFQRNYLKAGKHKESKLLFKNGTWFFNICIDIPRNTNHFAQSFPHNNKVLGVDLGENNLATTSSGKIFGGDQLRHERDCALALRARLQSNGSKSAKQLLKKTSGREQRHVKHVNHVISKAIVKEAQETGCDTIAMEALTNIRSRIKARKRVRSRLHRWAWEQLQSFIEYKAQEAGLVIVFVNPAYTSQTCSVCEQLGKRVKHRFICNFCGIQRHSDLNASLNIRRIAESADTATGTANCPNVAIN
jgi:IS605 OrfB family transposase